MKKFKDWKLRTKIIAGIFAIGILFSPFTAAQQAKEEKIQQEQQAKEDNEKKIAEEKAQKEADEKKAKQDEVKAVLISKLGEVIKENSKVEYIDHNNNLWNIRVIDTTEDKGITTSKNAMYHVDMETKHAETVGVKEEVSISSSLKANIQTTAKEIITKNLKAPSTAKFPGMFSDGYKYSVANGKVRLDSYVDSQNSFGAMIRTFYTAEANLETNMVTIINTRTN